MQVVGGHSSLHLSVCNPDGGLLVVTVRGVRNLMNRKLNHGFDMVCLWKHVERVYRLN
jgi:hypothetical protein